MGQVVVSRLAKSLLALVVMTAGTAGAEVAFDLPQIVGTYEQGAVSFQMTFPRVHGLTSAHVELSGTQVGGFRYMCVEPFSRPAGSDARLVVRLPALPGSVFDTAEGTLPAGDGEWSASLPLLPNVAPVLSVGGLLDLEFSIGELYVPTLCDDFIVMPIVTIANARIVTDGVVPADAATWGGVKGLYR